MSLRAQIRSGIAALWTALTLTIQWQVPSIPEELLVAWGGVFFAATGVGEAVFDYYRKGDSPAVPEPRG